MKLKDLRISTQMHIGMGFIILLVAILGATAWFQANTLWQSAKDLYEHSLQVRRALNILSLNILTMHRDMKDLVMADNEQERQSIIQAIDTSEAEAIRQFDILYDRYLGSRKDIEEIRTVFASWKTIRSETIRLLRTGKTTEAFRRTKVGGAGGRQVEDLLNEVHVMIKGARDRSDMFYEEAKKNKDFLLIQLSIVFGVIFLSILSISYILLKNIKNPLNDLTVLTGQFAQGKMGVRSRYASTNEFGTLAASFNALAETIQSEWLNKESAARLVEELRETNAYLENLINYANAPIIVWDQQFRITRFNHAFESLTGRSEAEVIGQSLEILFPSALVEESMALIGKTKTGERWDEVEIKIIHRDQSVWTVLWNSATIFALDGQTPIATIAQGYDITLRKQAEDTIIAKNKELESYLYIASHDLRSPLVNIQGFSHRLQKQVDSIEAALTDCALPPAAKAGIDAITHDGIPKTLYFILPSVAKMDILLKGLLRISRTGRTIMVIKEIDISQLFQTIIDNFNFQLTQLNATIIAKDLPSCYGDENLLNQLFSNIIGNAIKYHDENRRLVIEITARKEHQKVIYSIRDNGLGVESRHLKKIWDIFYRVDSASADSGEGMGLNIAKRIAEKHKGLVWAESSIGKGSTFYVELQTSEFSDTQ